MSNLKNRIKPKKCLSAAEGFLSDIRQTKKTDYGGENNEKGKRERGSRQCYSVVVYSNIHIIKTYFKINEKGEKCYQKGKKN